MPRSKRPKIVYLLIAATLVVMVGAYGPSARASAPPDTVLPASVGSPVTSRGDLTAELDSSTPITAVTAQLRTINGTPTTDVLDVQLINTEGPSPSGDYIRTGWSVPAPITPNQLAHGTYEIELVVTFLDQTTLTLINAGRLQFLDEPVITLTADHTGIGYDYSSVVNLTGHVDILAPDGTQSPYADGSVQLIGSGTYTTPTSSVMTDGSGDFSAQLTITGIGASIAAQVNGTDTLDTQRSTTLVFATVPPDAIQFSNVRLNQPTINYGAADVLTGTLKYLPNNTGTTYQPLPSQPVQVYNSLNPNTAAATGMTDSNGNFTISLATSNKITSTWTVKAGGNAQFAAAQASVKMTVRVPVAVGSFTASVNQWWQLSYSGCLNLAKSIPRAKFTSTANLVLQYSYNRAPGTWHNILWKPPVTRTCGNGGVWFSGSTIAPVNYAYYRVQYNGATTSGTVYLAATSATKLAWKYADRITSLSVGPKVVAKNGKVTVKGQLQYWNNGAWHNYGSQVVEIIFRQANTSTWYWIVKVKTNSTDHFSATIPVAGIGSATWTAQFNGNSTHLATAPPGVYVRVTG